MAPITGYYDTANIKITDAEIINNIGYVKRWSNTNLTQLQRLYTWIPDQHKADTLAPIPNIVASGLTQQNTQSEQWNSADYIFVKFTGCNTSVNIGTAYIRVSISIEPTATMRGVLKVTPRGFYEGTYRVLRQARKKGIPLEFLTSQ